MGDYRRGAEYLADYHADKSVVPYKAIEFKKSKKTQKVAEWSLDLGYALGGRKGQIKIRFLLDVRDIALMRQEETSGPEPRFFFCIISVPDCVDGDPQLRIIDTGYS
mmetsp:Transcript_4422/g.9855  ORF Transcript_4422/g.9855 Transcript_4422/m.9855 type:complete len:107 (+) Transcript_4422:794-1114(+)